MVCGAIVTTTSLFRSWIDFGAFDMYVEWRPLSRSMSTPSRPYSSIRPVMESAKAAADASLLIDTAPFWPPTEMTTDLPALCLARMSAVKSCTEP